MLACDARYPHVLWHRSRAGRGGSDVGASRSGLVLPCLSLLSFLGLSRFFSGFSPFSRNFPIVPFPLSWPRKYRKKTYEEQSRKGPRDNPDLSQKSGKFPGLETSRLTFSHPKGPKIEQIQDLSPGLKFLNEIEIFKQATNQGPLFCGEVWRPRLQTSSEILDGRNRAIQIKNR